MRKNPSVLRNVLKNKTIRKIYDVGFNFYYDLFAHSVPAKVRKLAQFEKPGPRKRMEELWLTFPREIGLVFAYEDLPPGFDGQVLHHKETNLHKEFISLTIRPLPTPTNAPDARRYFNALRGMYDHEFVHVIQLLQKYARGRSRWDKKYPNTMIEHKPHLEQLLAELRYRVAGINHTPIEDISGDVFADYVAQVRTNLKIWKSDTKMRRMILKDIWKAVEKIKAPEDLRKKLRKAGFPI